MTEADRSPLEKLILEVKDSEGKSYAQLASRAGFGPDGKARISAGGLQKFGSQRIERALKGSTVVALALALNVHPGVVRAAVAETLGYREPVPGQDRGYSAAWGLAERIDRVDDDEKRGKVLWAVERLVSAVEAELAEAEAVAVEAVPETALEADIRTVGEVGEELLDMVRGLDRDQLRQAIVVLDREFGDVPDSASGTAP